MYVCVCVCVHVHEHVWLSRSHPKIRGTLLFFLSPELSTWRSDRGKTKPVGTCFLPGTCSFPRGLRIRVVASSPFFLETQDMVRHPSRGALSLRRVFLSRGPRCKLCLLSSLSFSPWASPLQWDPQLLGQNLRLYSCNQGILEQGGVWACVLRLRCGAPCGKCLGSSPSPLLACWVALRITYLTALCLRALICGLRIVVTTPKIK